uniref:Pkinase_fungal domain-containing protein n=1 Tax=Steinernema glaseri TaxID=37863 RepID=A0A1I7YKR5_9BILA
MHNSEDITVYLWKTAVATPFDTFDTFTSLRFAPLRSASLDSLGSFVSFGSFDYLSIPLPRLDYLYCHNMPLVNAHITVLEILQDRTITNRFGRTQRAVYLMATVDNTTMGLRAYGPSAEKLMEKAKEGVALHLENVFRRTAQVDFNQGASPDEFLVIEKTRLG